MVRELKARDRLVHHHMIPTDSPDRGGQIRVQHSRDRNSWFESALWSSLSFIRVFHTWETSGSSDAEHAENVQFRTAFYPPSDQWNRTRSAAVLFDEKVGEQVLLVCVTLTLLTLLMVGSSGLCAVHVRLAAFALAGGVSVHIAMHGFG